MLLALFFSSALLLGTVFQVNAENPDNANPVGSAESRKDRQFTYWPKMEAPLFNPTAIYRNPWLSSYFSRYYPSNNFQKLPYFYSGYPFSYGAPEPTYFDSDSDADSDRLSWNEEAVDETEAQVQSRQGVSLNNFFANRPFINNPNQPSFLSLNDGCNDPNGLGGICLPSVVCRANGGRPSGSCTTGLKLNVCCINTVNTCGSAITMNNTFWQSAPTVTTGTTCAVALNIANNIPNLRRPICRVRLDFVSFILEQPNQQTVCNTDTFTVTGASETVPVICGTNSGQHMYLTPFQPNGNLLFTIKMGTTTLTRSWNIKVSMLPCGANYLPPKNCLQYFMSGAGTVQSFNYEDVATSATATRQLASQDYMICFRRELVSSVTATQVCFTQCRVTSTPNPSAFSLTLDPTAGAQTANSDAGTCKTDFLLIPNSFDPNNNPTTVFQDRYCGTALSPVNAATPTTVCTRTRDFAINYRTDAAEATGEQGNLGFCLNFQEKTG